jgi:hypothetical protein
VKSEPASLISIITAFLVAVIGLGAAFGLDISEEQRNAVIAVVAPAAGVIALLGPIIRQYVFAPDTVEGVNDKAYAKGVAGEVKPTVQGPP